MIRSLLIATALLSPSSPTTVRARPNPLTTVPPGCVVNEGIPGDPGIPGVPGTPDGLDRPDGLARIDCPPSQMRETSHLPATR